MTVCGAGGCDTHCEKADYPIDIIEQLSGRPTSRQRKILTFKILTNILFHYLHTFWPLAYTVGENIFATTKIRNDYGAIHNFTLIKELFDCLLLFSLSTNFL